MSRKYVFAHLSRPLTRPLFLADCVHSLSAISLLTPFSPPDSRKFLSKTRPALALLFLACAIILLTNAALLLFRARVPYQKVCMAVDILRFRTPGALHSPPPSELNGREALAYGDLCLDVLTNKLGWSIDESFSAHYHLRRLSLVERQSPDSALQLGVQHTDAIRHRLSGQLDIQRDALLAMIRRPEDFYVVLEGSLDRNGAVNPDSSSFELGRSPLLVVDTDAATIFDASQ